jgi:sulfate transport system substrate-binding protein
MKLRSILAATVVALFALAQTAQASTILNVSYDPTREFYAAYNALFAAYWKKKTGDDLTVQQSHGGSGSQARAVIQGLEADVVTLALSYDIDAIAKAKLLAPDWASRLPDDSSPYTSTIVLLVRAGNPKHIRDWGDVAKPGVAVIAANPKTGGGARWNFLAAYSYGLKRNHNDEAKARAFVSAVYKNVTVLDAAARASTVTFTERGLGDVLIAWENEAILAMREHPGQYELVVPSVSILAEPPVAVVDANVAKHGTAAVAKAYLQYLYTPQAQRLACAWGYRPRLLSVYGKCGTSFPRTDLTTIADFGGWTAAQARFFADGGVFDQVYSSK